MRSSRAKQLLPLLRALQAVPPAFRVIILSHFDDKTRDGIYETINTTLQSEHVPFRKRLFLRSKLANFRREFRTLSNPKASSSEKKRKLCMVGAGPMQHLLRAAVPLLINTYTFGKRGAIKRYKKK